MKLFKIDPPRIMRDQLMKPFPSELIQEKPDKNRSKYIPGETVIDKLNATFGYFGWDWDIIDKWISQPDDRLVKTKYENGQKINLPQNQWTYEKQLPVMNVIGKLTIKLEKEDGSIYTISRTAPGSQSIANGAQRDFDMAVKGAHTDALKKAASTFGIALELYRKTPAQRNYFYDITYESPWTDEEIEKHKDDFTYIYSFKDKYKLSNDEFSQLINNCFQNGADSLEQIPPDYISSFVAFLQGVEKDNTDNAGTAGENDNGN